MADLFKEGREKQQKSMEDPVSISRLAHQASKESGSRLGMSHAMEALTHAMNGEHDKASDKHQVTFSHHMEKAANAETEGERDANKHAANMHKLSMKVNKNKANEYKSFDSFTMNDVNASGKYPNTLSDKYRNRINSMTTGTYQTGNPLANKEDTYMDKKHPSAMAMAKSKLAVQTSQGIDQNGIGSSSSLDTANTYAQQALDHTMSGSCGDASMCHDTAAEAHMSAADMHQGKMKMKGDMHERAMKLHQNAADAHMEASDAHLAQMSDMSGMPGDYSEGVVNTGVAMDPKPPFAGNGMLGGTTPIPPGMKPGSPFANSGVAMAPRPSVLDPGPLGSSTPTGGPVRADGRVKLHDGMRRHMYDRGNDIRAGMYLNTPLAAQGYAGTMKAMDDQDPVYMINDEYSEDDCPPACRTFLNLAQYLIDGCKIAYGDISRSDDIQARQQVANICKSLTEFAGQCQAFGVKIKEKLDKALGALPGGEDQLASNQAAQTGMENKALDFNEASDEEKKIMLDAKGYIIVKSLPDFKPRRFKKSDLVDIDETPVAVIEKEEEVVTPEQVRELRAIERQINEKLKQFNEVKEALEARDARGED